MRRLRDRPGVFQERSRRGEQLENRRVSQEAVRSREEQSVSEEQENSSPRAAALVFQRTGEAAAFRAASAAARVARRSHRGWKQDPADGGADGSEGEPVGGDESSDSTEPPDLIRRAEKEGAAKKQADQAGGAKPKEGANQKTSAAVGWLAAGLTLGTVLVCILACLRNAKKLSDPFSNPYLDQEPDFTYNPEELASWRAFSFVRDTAFVDGRVWELLAVLTLLALVSCLTVLLLTGNPADLKVDKFNEVTKLLKVFVAFMLGLYVSASYNRFLAIVKGVFQLFNGCKDMLSMTGTLGVPLSHRAILCRYAVLACNLLSYEGQYMFTARDQSRDLWLGAFQDLEKRGLLETKERELLESAMQRGAQDPSQMCLIWVESYIAKLAVEGLIPAMPTPTYGRMMQVSVSSMQSGLRTVKQNLSVQTPFAYNHLLAVMVHVNNLMTAVMSGVMIGATLGKMRQGRCGLDYAIQSIFLSLFMSIVGPFLYQAFLIIGASMADPFDQEGAADQPVLPMRRLVENLSQDLTILNEFVGVPPGWEPPSFKVVAAAPPPPQKPTAPPITPPPAH